MGPSDLYDLCCKLTESTFNLQVLSPIPICSMSGIFTNIVTCNIYRKFNPNVGKYNIHGASGIDIYYYIYKKSLSTPPHIYLRNFFKTKKQTESPKFKACHVCTKNLPRPKKKSPEDNYFPTTKNGRNVKKNIPNKIHGGARSLFIFFVKKNNHRVGK